MEWLARSKGEDMTLREVDGVSRQGAHVMCQFVISLSIRKDCYTI